jgi:ribosomal protein L22
LSNPVLQEYLHKKEIQEALKDARAASERVTLREGELSTHPSSLFLQERELPGWKEGMSPEQRKQLEKRAEQQKAAADKEKQRRLKSMKTDPDPTARRSLERKLVIAGVKRHGRLTKAQNIARTERTSLYKSDPIPTSTKKLQMVTNQIAGKTVSEALVQLRFSPKKIARDVMKGLEIAQNEAIVGKGMGLQGGKAAMQRWEQQRTQTDMGKPRDIWDYKTSPEDSSAVAKTAKFQPTTIELKNGSKKTVRDPSEIYIDQIWVGKHLTSSSPEFRARGRVNMLRHRSTSKLNYPLIYKHRSMLTLTSLHRPLERRKDTHAHLGRDPEEARQQEALAPTP